MTDATPIGERLSNHLELLDQSPAWLARSSGVARSTVSRALSGSRIPSIETLATFAPVLGLSLEELVAGTNVEVRVDESQRLIARPHYDAAVAQVIEFERRADTCERRVRELQGELKSERSRRREHQQIVKDLRVEADQSRRDARRYGIALRLAVADVARLRTLVEELRVEVESSRRSSHMASALAGVAAIASVASYLRSATAEVEHDDNETGENE